jgi:hypothetical protein
MMPNSTIKARPTTRTRQITGVTPLSPVIKKSFYAWINCDTWYTGHPSDEARFYSFVWNVFKYSRKRPTEQYLRELILEQWRGSLDPDYLETVALKYSNLYATLLEFAKTRKRGILFLPSEFE